MVYPTEAVTSLEKYFFKTINIFSPSAGTASVRRLNENYTNLYSCFSNTAKYQKEVDEPISVRSIGKPTFRR